MKNKQAKGFTLIELLIVIGIIAILATVVILTLNPAELLRQARDTTRISDLDTLRSALSLYLADVAPIDLGTPTTCYASFEEADLTGFVIADCGGRSDGSVILTAVVTSSDGTADLVRYVNGSGWIPVDLAAISSGAPISALPTDPVKPNTFGVVGDILDDYYYAYMTDGSNTFEVNARLESIKFASSSENDGGAKIRLYEVGTNPGLNY